MDGVSMTKLFEYGADQAAGRAIEMTDSRIKLLRIAAALNSGCYERRQEGIQADRRVSGVKRISRRAKEGGRMSHFSVLVVGDDVAGQLQPFHEFECTGVDDQYVQTIDITDKARAEYESATCYRLRDNVSSGLHDPYEEWFYRDPTAEEVIAAGRLGFMGTGVNGKDGRGYRAKIKFIPEGWEEIKLPVSEVETFADWAADWYGLDKVGCYWEDGEYTPYRADGGNDKHKYGWIRVDDNGEVVAVIDRTNPDAHWDWWVVGGRWSNRLALMDGVGQARMVDQARKGEIDWDFMRDKAANEARDLYRRAHAIIASRPIPNWGAMLGENLTRAQMDAVRDNYNTDLVVIDLRAAEIWDFDEGYERFDCTETEYADRAARGALATFAVVVGGQWYERGSMGWWGVVSGEKDDDEWNRQFEELVMGLSDDTLLTVVDCHI